MSHATRKIKVLQVSKFFSPRMGGLEKVLNDLTEGLKDRTEMRVLVCQPRGRGYDEVGPDNLFVRRASSLGTYFSMPVSLSFPFLLAREDPDIIHYHLPFPLATIAHQLVRPRARTVVTWHNDIIKQKKLLRLYARPLRAFLRQVDRIIVTSANLLESSPFLREVREKCVVIPLGIDPGFFAPTAPSLAEAARLRDQYGTPLLLTVGRMVYYKGYSYLIDALREVPDATLLLIGAGQLEAKLRAQARAAGLGNRLVFLPPVYGQALVPYFHACDLFILASTYNSESFGLVLLEAMACGKPVISTDLPTGVSYVNQHGRTGLIVPPRDAHALAGAVRELLADPSRRAEMGQYARERVTREFDVRTTIDRTLALYQELVSPGAPVTPTQHPHLATPKSSG